MRAVTLCGWGVGGGKTGGLGGPRVVLGPKPPRVEDRYRYWVEAPPELSARCRFWLDAIERGFRPNRRWRQEDYDTSAGLFGVYVWEYLHVLWPALRDRGAPA